LQFKRTQPRPFLDIQNAATPELGGAANPNAKNRTCGWTVAIKTKKAEDISSAFFVYNLALAPTAAEHQQLASPSVPSQR
jgi:hypothetical protein